MHFSAPFSRGCGSTFDKLYTCHASLSTILQRVLQHFRQAVHLLFRPRSPVAAALELESAAPPMDLDRPSRLGSSPVPRLPLPNLSTYTLPPLESRESAQDTSNLEDSRERDGSVTPAASPADASAAKVADPTGKDRPSKPVAIAEDATDASDNSERGRKAFSIIPAEGVTLQGTRDEDEWSAKTDIVTEFEAAGADTTSSWPLQGPQEQQEWPVEGEFTAFNGGQSTRLICELF